MVQVLLDNVDITDSLNKQYPLPETAASGVWPSRNSSEWYDLMACLNDHPELAEGFFDGGENGVHTLEVVNPTGLSFQVRLLLRMKYSARNR